MKIARVYWQRHALLPPLPSTHAAFDGAGYGGFCCGPPNRAPSGFFSLWNPKTVLLLGAFALEPQNLAFLSANFCKGARNSRRARQSCVPQDHKAACGTLPLPRSCAWVPPKRPTARSLLKDSFLTPCTELEIHRAFHILTNAHSHLTNAPMSWPCMKNRSPNLTPTPEKH